MCIRLDCNTKFKLFRNLPNCLQTLDGTKAEYTPSLAVLGTDLLIIADYIFYNALLTNFKCARIKFVLGALIQRSKNKLPERVSYIAHRAIMNLN